MYELLIQLCIHNSNEPGYVMIHCTHTLVSDAFFFLAEALDKECIAVVGMHELFCDNLSSAKPPSHMLTSSTFGSVVPMQGPHDDDRGGR